MKRLLLIACACGASAQPGSSALPSEPASPPVVVEWKVHQGEGSQVDVTFVVDGTPYEIGSLEGAATYEVGPATCALRAASPVRTELVCGTGDAYEAVLGEGQLVISHLGGDPRRVVKRVPVIGDALAVKMLALPFDDS